MISYTFDSKMVLFELMRKNLILIICSLDSFVSNFQTFLIIIIFIKMKTILLCDFIFFDIIIYQIYNNNIIIYKQYNRI